MGDGERPDNQFELDEGPITPERLGDCALPELLETGALVDVFRGERAEPPRHVIVTLVRPGIAAAEAITRFEREAGALRGLEHPGVERIVDAGVVDLGDGPRPYVVREHVDGEPVTEHGEGPGLAPRKKLELLAQACEAIEHAHSNGVVHGAVSPKHMLVTGTGRVVVTGFGLAAVTGSAERTMRLGTDVGHLVDTLPYLSPEQTVEGAGAVDGRSDVYALGVVGYELLTGRQPHGLGQQRTSDGTVRIVPEASMTRLRSINRMHRGAVETLIEHALERDPADRYPSAGAFADDIRRHLSGRPVAVRPRRRSRGAEDRDARFGLVTVLAAAALIVAVAAGAWGWSRTIAEAYEQRQQRMATEGQRDAAAAGAREAADRVQALEDELARHEQEQRADRAQLAELEEEVLTLTAQRGEAYDAGFATGITRIIASVRAMQQEQRDAEARHGIAVELVRTTESKVEALRDRITEKDVAIRAAEEAHALTRASLDAERAGRERAEAESARVASVLALLSETIERAAAATEGGAGTTLVELIDAAEARLEATPADGAESAVELRVVLGAWALAAGLPDRAERLLEGAHALLLEEHGADDPRTLHAAHELSIALAAVGRTQAAASLLDDTIQRRERVLGPDHAATLRSLEHLAGLHRQAGRRGLAEAELGRLLSLRGSTLGDGHPDTLRAGAALAELYVEQHRFEEAEPLLARQVEVLRRERGEDDVATLTAVQTLAEVHAALGRYASAEQQMLETLARFRRKRGADDEGTLRSLYQLALVYEARGQFREAEPLLLQALERRRRVLGDDHPDTQEAMQNLVGLYRYLERHDEAEDLSRELLRLRQTRARPEGE